MTLDEIKTADVEQLRDSSKSELVADLNRRAQMFNPALILFGLAGIIAIAGFALLANSSPTAAPSLPDVSSSSTDSRQTNRTDEYALLLARYGQPTTVVLTQSGTATLRTATWAQTHLAVSLVSAGCVEAYSYFQMHKNDPIPSHALVRHHAAARPVEPMPPVCVQPTNNASTIVGYEDAVTHVSIDSFAAERAFSGLTRKSKDAPIVTVADVPAAKGHPTKIAAPPAVIAYDQSALEQENQRQREAEAAESRARKEGAVSLTTAVLLLVPGIVVHRKNREKRTTQLIYELSEQAKARQGELEGALGHLSRSGAIWRLDSQSAVLDWKRNAGAAYNVKRERVAVRKEAPPRIESNVEPVCLDLGKLRMFFLPDQMLYWQRGVFASIEYSDLKFESASTRFIEESVQSSDSKQVGTTWRYVRKDGGPDRRFNNNRQLPVMQYGVVTAVSSHGLNLVLHTSNLDAASAFSGTFELFQTARARGLSDGLPSGNHEESSRQASSDSTIYPANIVEAMSVLEIKRGATGEDVAVAYRHMAQMYHPDKTMGLGPELQQLAEQKMKQINAAHQELKRFFEKG
jgi:PAS domain-containing protein